MNVKTVALCILFLAFGFIAKAEKSSDYPISIGNIAIPGGIVYSDGKDAIYYDFKTQKIKNLTYDLSEAVVRHPFAVSENGKVLIWGQNYKFYVRKLPIGIPYVVQADKTIWKEISGESRTSSSKNDIKEDIIWQAGDIKNMSLSPDGSRFAFDAIFQEPGWVFTGKTVYGQFGVGKGPHPHPFYAKIIDPYNGIFYLSTIYNKNDNSPADDPVEINFGHPRYGNVVKRPPVPFYKASWQDSFPSKPYDPSIKEWTGTGGETDTGEMLCYKRTFKKNAYYLTFQNLQNWEQEKKLAAFIYQIGNQWGPIELRVLDSTIQGGPGDEFRQGHVSYFSTKSEEPPKNVQKPREWEILLSFKSCEGLFWKPDGSLTIQSGGDLYLIDALQIQRGIDKSRVKKQQKGNMVKFLPFNNVFTAKPKLVAQGINGACISWVSNDAFLFLGKDMIVYLWWQGKTEKALYSPISSEFYYCSRSPFEDIKNPDILAGNNKSSDSSAISGVGKAMEGTPAILNIKTGEEDKINFGPIQTMWEDVGTNNSLCIWLNLSKKPLQFALIEDEDNLDNIKDPSQYEYLSGQERKVTVVNNDPAAKRAYQKALKDSKKNLVGFVHEEIKMFDNKVVVPLNRIIILKLDTAYVAIKPISIRLKYKSVKEVPKWAQKSWEKEIEKGKVPPIHDLMTYEWKYWPKVIPPAELAKTALNK